MNSRAKTPNCIHSCENPPCILNQYKGHRSPIRALCFHPNTDTLFSANEEGYIMSWDYKEQEPRSYRFDGHSGAINDLSLSMYGDLMISASNDSTVRMWVPISTGEVATIKAHKTSVRSAHFNPADQSVFATCSSDKLIKIWSIQNFKSSKKENGIKAYDFLHSFRDHRNWVNCIRFSPDGSLLCSASDDKTVKIYDMRQRKCAISIDNPMGRSLHSEFNPCGSTYVGVSSDRSSFSLFDIRDAKFPAQFYPNLFAAPVNNFAFHPSGDFVVCVSEDAKIKVLDLNEAHPIYTLYSAREALNAVAFTPTGCLFATGGKDKEILLWEHSMVPYKEEVETELEGEDAAAEEFQSKNQNPNPINFFRGNEEFEGEGQLYSTSSKSYNENFAGELRHDSTMARIMNEEREFEEQVSAQIDPLWKSYREKEFEEEGEDGLVLLYDYSKKQTKEIGGEGERGEINRPFSAPSISTVPLSSNTGLVPTTSRSATHSLP